MTVTDSELGGFTIFGWKTDIYSDTPRERYLFKYYRETPGVGRG